MKQIFTLLAIVTLNLTSPEVFASELAQKPLGDQAVLQAQFGEMNTSASDFIALSPKEIAKKTGKKMSWGERILFKIAQKRIKKQMEKSIQPPSAEGNAANGSKRGVISLILGGMGLVLALLFFLNPESAFLTILFLLGLVCGIVGLIFGIIGLKKDENKGAAIIGTILSTATVFFVGLVFFLIFTSDEG